NDEFMAKGSFPNLSITVAEVERAFWHLREEGLSSSPLILYAGFPSDEKIYLKMENLLPCGSFKIRAAQWAIHYYHEQLDHQGVWTASAGNMGKAIAYCARVAQIPCTVIVPDDAPSGKVQAIQAFGAKVVRVPFSTYQQIQVKSNFSAANGFFIHPFADPAVVTANATIALEIFEQLADCDAIFLPYGGGGLTCGIAQMVKSLKPHIHIVACEVETATPLTDSLKAGKPVNTSYRSSFVSGMGAPFVFPQMWDLAQKLVDQSEVVRLSEVAEAIRLLAHDHHVIAEGAAAVSLAAALKNSNKWKKVVCLITGGNIDDDQLMTIMKGNVPI
ncbi:MAG: threonine ammonia-lyase, partial [Anaerolineales bacterium]